MATNTWMRNFVVKAGIPLLAGAAVGLKHINVNQDPESATHSESSFSSLPIFFNLETHTLQQKDLRPNTVVIGGELPERRLFLYFGKTPPEYTNDSTYRIQALNDEDHFSTSATKEALREQDLVMKAAADRGIHLICPDNRHQQSVGITRMIDSYNIADEGQLAFGKTLVGVSILGVVEFIRETIRAVKIMRQPTKDGFPDPKRLSVGNPLLAFSGELVRLTNGGKDFTKAKEVLKVLLTYKIAEEAVETIDNPGKEGREVITEFTGSAKVFTYMKDEHLGRLFNIIDDRNVSMALGYHGGQQMLDDLGILPNIANPEGTYTCANGHMISRDYYENGVDFCQKRALEKIQDALDYSYDLIKNPPKNMSVEVSHIYWILATSGFSYPIGSYMKRAEYLNTPMKRSILSARSLLWRELEKRITNSPSDETLLKMRELLAKEDLEYFKMIDEIVPEIRQKATIQENCNLVREFQLSNGQNVSLRFMDGIPVVM